MSAQAERVIKSAAISGTIKSRAALARVPCAWVTRARVRDHTFLFRGKGERKDDFVADSLLGIWFCSLSLSLSRRSFVFCEITVKLRKKCMRNSVEHLQGHAGTVETFLQKKTRQIKNVINRCRLAVWCARGRVLKNVRALEKKCVDFLTLRLKKSTF